MSSNVLPSAPDYKETETQTLYPVLPNQPDNNFRMQKANEVLKYLSDEVSHYRLVAKKYKRTKTIINYAGFSAGGISGFLSAGGGSSCFYRHWVTCGTSYWLCCLFIWANSSRANRFL